MKRHINSALKILVKVFGEKTYSNILELVNDKDKRELFGNNSYNLLRLENNAIAVKDIILKHLG